ncbi:unnamed protein product [Staurois parvus]|uniref:Uncharacterized protein n=1 Tax=Staurois parvus TaxID=386267 RepID=A0ABN9EZH9_9NEOB|nr:unnamed protein product [Staurois parvus]
MFLLEVERCKDWCFIHGSCFVSGPPSDLPAILTTSARKKSLQNKVPEKQKFFQKDDDVPVHLKGGISDVILYRVTMLLTILGN